MLKLGKSYFTLAPGVGARVILLHPCPWSGGGVGAGVIPVEP